MRFCRTIFLRSSFDAFVVKVFDTLTSVWNLLSAIVSNPLFSSRIDWNRFEILDNLATSKATRLASKCQICTFDTPLDAPGSGFSSARQINSIRHTYERMESFFWNWLQNHRLRAVQSTWASLAGPCGKNFSNETSNQNSRTKEFFVLVHSQSKWELTSLFFIWKNPIHFSWGSFLHNFEHFLLKMLIF